MSALRAGQHVVGIKALSYADTSSDAAFEPDSYVLLLGDGSSLTLTSGTDWTMQVEPGTFPDLPDWAWPPESWRYEGLDAPLGEPGFDIIREVSELYNEVRELTGFRVRFDAGTIEFRSGESTSLMITK